MQHFNVIFLLDTLPPKRILLLKRAPEKAFAPNWYTGVGGKVEIGETFDESALRELEEETGLSDTALYKFACAYVGGDTVLHYYYGFYDGDAPHCPEGILGWVAEKDLLKKAIIPSTAAILEIWQSRNYTKNGFTLTIRRKQGNTSLQGVTIEKIQDQLCE